jgi:hypothetical protein
VLIYNHFTGVVAAKLRPALDKDLCMSSRNRIITVNASVLNKNIDNGKFFPRAKTMLPYET